MREEGKLLAEAKFVCILCGEVAGHVRAIHTTQNGIRLERWNTSYLIEEKLDAHLDALRSEDVHALFALNFEYTPFYCPKCDAIFCRAHWQIWQEFEDEPPYWPECIRGTCPNGHTRMLED